MAVAAVLGVGGPAAAAPAPTPPVLPTHSAVCPDQVAPPQAIDASEDPKPGQVAPAPVPEPATPAGGPQMAGCDYVLPRNAPPLPADLGFESWVLQDLDTGAVLAARDPHARQRPASLIKLLLAQVVVRELNPNTVIVGTQDDANQDGTLVGIGPGGQYPVGLLVHGLLMASGNDVAYALATQLGGVQTTVAKMNAVARQFGMMDTRAASPSGLDAPGMSTSAYDLSVIFRTNLTNPLIADAVRTTQVQFPGYGGKPPFMVNNDNELLRDYQGDLGGKTGYTDDAQQTYANAAARDGHRVALVMTRGTNHLSGRWQNARELMDYGFTLENLHTTPVGHLVAAADPAAPTADQIAKQIQETTGHGNAQVAGVPATSMTTFGTVGLPLTILAGVTLVLIGLLFWKRQKSRARRAAAARAAASAKTVRVAAVAPPTDLAPAARSRTVEAPTERTTNGAAAARTRTVQPVSGQSQTQHLNGAALSANGGPTGTRTNGTPVNGTPVNGGAPVNGAPVNGTPVNGVPVNGSRGINGAGAPAKLPFPDPFNADPFNADPYRPDPYGSDPYSADPFRADPYGADPYGTGSHPTGSRGTGSHATGPGGTGGYRTGGANGAPAERRQTGDHQGQPDDRQGTDRQGTDRQDTGRQGMGDRQGTGVRKPVRQAVRPTNAHPTNGQQPDTGSPDWPTSPEWPQ